MPGVLDVLIGPVSAILDKFIPDADKKMQAKLELAKLADAAASREHDEMMGQIATNTEEAKHGTMFVAGWRPFIGWTGGVGLAYSFVVEPIMSWVAKVGFGYVGTFPAVDTSSLMVLVTGMLGFGGLRTYEKFKGVSHEGSLPPTEQAPNSVAPVAAQKKKKKILGVAVPPWL
jgi:hypothetical protein